MTTRTITQTALQGETLDALVWRVLGGGSDVTCQVLDLNRGIAGLGAVLPEGYVVRLPAATATTTPTYDIVQLWD